MSFPGACSQYIVEDVESYFLYGQLLQTRQRAGQQAHYKGSGGAHNVQHGGREHRDVGVLPGEGVE